MANLPIVDIVRMVCITVKRSEQIRLLFVKACIVTIGASKGEVVIAYDVAVRPRPGIHIRCGPGPRLLSYFAAHSVLPFSPRFRLIGQ